MIKKPYSTLGLAACFVAISTPFALAYSSAEHAGHEASAHAEDTEHTTDSMQILHNLGWFISQNVQQFDLNEAEKEAFMTGFSNGLEGGEGPEDTQAADAEIRNFLQTRFEAKQKTENAAFIKEVESIEGIKQSDTGLYYKIIEPGTGPKATRADKVTVHYVGTLPDGTTFDSSRERGQPATFPVSGVVPGFGEGVQMIGEGGKIKLYIKPELGYGSRPAGKIPPNSFLVFDVEMIEVLPSAEEDSD
jgi:FKBP-type peptidyl-prolyl cis-trans isomerase